MWLRENKHVWEPALPSPKMCKRDTFYDPFDPRYACLYVHHPKGADWSGWLQEYAKVCPRATGWIAGPVYSVSE